MPGHEGDNTEIKKNFESYPKIFNLIVEFSPISKLYVSVNTIDPASIVFKYDLTGIEFYRVKEIKDDDIVISDKDLVINEDDDEETKDEKNRQIRLKKEEIKNQKIDEEKLKKTNTEKSKKEEIESYVQIRVSLSGDNITYIKSILDSISTATSTPPLPTISTSNGYFKYSDAPVPGPVNLPFALTQMDESNFDNFDTFSVYFPDIFNYLKWVINIKKHPKNIPIFVVSHSGTMQNFLKKIFYCFNQNGLLPDDTFIDTYKYCTKTNLWSLRLYYMGYSIIIFRHGFTCDNMYKEGNAFIARASGIYSNLSIWGILSVGKFYNLNKNILTNITGINKNNILSVMYGIPKQSKGSITNQSLPNEITCGKDITERFNHSQLGDSYFYLPSPPINTTELQKYMQLIHVKSVLSSDIDSDIDKDIQELISVEFIKCPGGNLFSGIFGCIKLVCVYNKRSVVIRPYTDKKTNATMYEITFYNIDPDNNELVVYEKTNGKFEKFVQLFHGLILHKLTLDFFFPHFCNNISI